jgi:hypothetical protein
MHNIEEVEIGDYRFTMNQDECWESPREWDNLGTILGWMQRYQSPDKNDFADPNDFMEWFLGEHANDPDHVLLPLFKFEHGGVIFSTGDFGDKWDSGQVGWVYATGETVRNEGLTKESATTVLENEVKTYSQYANGEVYSWSIYQKNGCDACGHAEWNHVEGCGGYFGGIEAGEINFPEGAYTEFREAVEKVLK